MRRWQYITDEALVLGYIFLEGPLPAEELVSRLGRKRATLLPKLYSLRDEGKLQQTSSSVDWRAKPYNLTNMGLRDVERYHLADAVRAYLEDSAKATPIKEERRRSLTTEKQEGETLVEVPAPVIARSRAMKVNRPGEASLPMPQLASTVSAQSTARVLERARKRRSKKRGSGRKR